MEIESPYIEADQHAQILQEQYDVNSADALVQQITSRIEAEYPLTVDDVDYLRIPHDIVARIHTSAGRFYFKTVTEWVSDITGVLDFVAYLRSHGLPLPAIKQTELGQRLISFEGSDAYLCSRVPGTPLSPTAPPQLSAYASLLATIHDLGERYAVTAGEVTSSKASNESLNARIETSLPHLREGLFESADTLFSGEQLNLLQSGVEFVENTYEEHVPVRLPQTHIHGDFRLCHVLQRNGTITGVLDFDEVTYGERLADVCFGLISAPEPNNGKAIPLALQRHVLQEYDTHQTLTPTERAALPTLLVWSNLMQLNGLCVYHREGVRDTTSAQKATVRDIDDLLKHKSVIPDEWLWF